MATHEDKADSTRTPRRLVGSWVKARKNRHSLSTTSDKQTEDLLFDETRRVKPAVDNRHTGRSHVGLGSSTVSLESITVTLGSITVSLGSITVTLGSITVSLGSITVTLGSVTVSFRINHSNFRISHGKFRINHSKFRINHNKTIRYQQSIVPTAIRTPSQPAGR